MKKLIRITSVPISMEKLLGNQLTFMNDFYEVTAVSSSEEYLKNLAINLGIKHHTVHMTRKITPLKDVQSIYKMYRFFRRCKPDIVHSHTPKAGLVSMIAAYLARVPIRLHTVAGLPMLESVGFKRKVLFVVEWLTYKLCTKVYPNSNALKTIILKGNFCSESKLKVLGNGSSNGVDLSHFNPTAVSTEVKNNLRKALNIEKDDFVFIFLGRLVKDKGINELVSAFKNLSEIPIQHYKSCAKRHRKRISIQKRLGSLDLNYDTKNLVVGLDLRQRLGRLFRHHYPTSLPKQGYHYNKPHFQRKYQKVKLLLVGPLEQEHNPITATTLSEIRTNPQIIHTGYVQDVRPFLALSSCLLLPSYREGFPNVVLQSGAMGVPSIVTDINGCNEIVEHECNGLLIPVKNEGALLNAMKHVLNHKNVLQKLKRNSRNIIMEKYCQTTIWGAILKEYKELEEFIHKC